MQTTAFDAALRWDAPTLFAPEVRKRVHLGEGESFGLLERVEGGWALCIPSGAHAEASVDQRPVDLDRLRLDPSGERRLELCEGLRARVWMGEFCFELTPSS